MSKEYDMKKLSKILLITIFAVTLALSVFVLSACGKGNGSDDSGSGLPKITGVTLSDKTYTYDGQPHSLEVSGTIPEGVSVAYEGNGKTNAGTYTVKATLSGEEYQTLVLSATLKINKANITGIELKGDELTYDGQPHSLAIEGTLPEGVSVAYENNGKTNAGSYTVKAIISGDNHNALELSATLKINKADITSIEFKGDTVTYDGQPHSLAIEGTLPDGVSVSYANNGKVEAGAYTVTATISGANYNTLELTATLRILPNLSALAQSIMDSFGKTPDIWEFLPESFRLTPARAYTGNILDFSNNVQISSIPTTGIGKQLDVIYGTVIDMQNLLGYVNTFYGATNSIAGLYQEYINAHPDDYANFQGSTAGGVSSFKITLTDSKYFICAKVGSVAIELTSDIVTQGYTGRVQLSDGNALKFDVGENTLKIALKIIGRVTTQLEFVRSGSTVVGYMYESLTVAGAELSTSAMLTYSGNTVAVCGTKGDFIPTSKGKVVEIYDAASGRYLGSKVNEVMPGNIAEYDTYWFNLSNIYGFNTIRNDGDDFYLNGNLFKSKKTTVIGGSRRYDIEMKKTYYYTYDAETQKYSKMEMEIPQLFIQEKYYGSFVSDVKGENSYLGTVTNNVPQSTVTVLDYYYVDGLKAYDKIADAVTAEDIIAYIGEKNAWFN